MTKAKTTSHKKKLSTAMQNHWQNPEFRKKMIEKQQRNGLRLR